MSAIPVLDLAAFRDDESGAGGGRFVADLRREFHEVGLAYLAGHGIDPVLAARVHAVARAFFDLPEAQRLEIENIRSPQFRGYTRLGGERTNGLQDLREQVDVAREEAVAQIGPGDPPWLRLRGPNLWPSALPEFETVVTAWNAELERVGMTLVRAISLALGQAAGRLDDLFVPAEIRTKIIRYPAPSEDFPTEQGVGSHRDGGFLTFVQQDDVGGLQAEARGGWVDVPAREGTLVVNLGEMLQVISSGYFRATPHRVVSPPAGHDRISIAYFFNPSFDAHPIPVELPPELAAEAPGGQSTDPDDPILSNFGEQTLKVRLRAHPDVAAIHHADLAGG